ncbi:MAG: hypothetical protein GY822_19935 [Deltaproteobacteria bacterium]|nr:hypothetical protein [Deltaproteobacteria bacterium]
MKNSILLALSLCALLPVVSVATGCEEPVLIDPEVTFTLREEIVAIGDPGMFLGIYEEQLFRPLEPSGTGTPPEIPIIYGFQGGTWLMPAVRCTGVSQTITFTADLSGPNAEVLGHVPPSRVRLDLTPDGTLDANALPIPVERADPENDVIEDLYGQEGHVFIQGVDASGEIISLEMAVTFIEG